MVVSIHFVEVTFLFKLRCSDKSWKLKEDKQQYKQTWRVCKLHGISCLPLLPEEPSLTHLEMMLWMEWTYSNKKSQLEENSIQALQGPICCLDRLTPNLGIPLIRGHSEKQLFHESQWKAKWNKQHESLRLPPRFQFWANLGGKLYLCNKPITPFQSLESHIYRYLDICNLTI